MDGITKCRVDVVENSNTVIFSTLPAGNYFPFSLSLSFPNTGASPGGSGLAEFSSKRTYHIFISSFMSLEDNYRIHKQRDALGAGR